MYVTKLRGYVGSGLGFVVSIIGGIISLFSDVWVFSCESDTLL